MMSEQPERFGRRVLREDVKEYLIDAILRGQLRAGEHIVEMRLAQQLGVSQGPVREALRDLELFGLVVRSPFRGTQVRQVSREDIAQVYPLRAAIEGVAARATTTRINAATLRELERLIERMYDAARCDDSHAHGEADVAFHRTIVEASGNGMLVQFWQSMRLATTTFITVILSHRSLEELTDRHEPVLAALRAGDPHAAEAAMRWHIEELGNWILAEPPSEDGPNTAKVAEP
jgi:DNA-binding GntR family transcriptional regulator